MILPVQLAALSAHPQFIIHRLIKNLDDTLNKIPLNAYTTKNCDAHNPKNWLTFVEAEALAKLYGKDYGVSFVLTDNDPFFVIDLDHCLILTKGLPLVKPNYFPFLSTFKDLSAFEISTSGDGLHIWGSCSGQPAHSSRSQIKQVPAELYHTKRFIALTGNMLYDTGSVKRLVDNQLSEIIDIYFSKPSAIDIGVWTDTAIDGYEGTWTDEEIVTLARKSRSTRALFGQKASFDSLWNKKVDSLRVAFPPAKNGQDFNASEADAALAQHLAFWTGNNCARIDQIMRKSDLYRDKYERPDYLRRTILAACGRQRTFAKPPRVAANNHTGSTSRLLDAAGTCELFKHCVYVINQHAVYTAQAGLLKPDQFRVYFGGYSIPLDVNNTKFTKDAFKALTEAEYHIVNKVHTTCFRPDCASGEILTLNSQLAVNIWQPPAVRAVSGDFSPFLDLISKLIPDERDQAILISYFAACVQYPGVKFKWAPFLQGATEGSGKSLLSDCVAYAVGQQYVHWPQPEQLLKDFNSWMYGNILICVDEIPYAVGVRAYDRLKIMLDATRAAVEPKGVDAVTKDICCNFIFTSNHTKAFKITSNTRRLAVFYTAAQTLQDLARLGLTQEYFITFLNWLKNEDGYAITAGFLQTFEIPYEFNPAGGAIRAPVTSSTPAAIQVGTGRVGECLREAIEEDIPGFKGGWLSSAAIERYLTHRCKLKDRSHRTYRTELLEALGYIKHPGLPEGRTVRNTKTDGCRPRLYILRTHSLIKITDARVIEEAYDSAQSVLDSN